MSSSSRRINWTSIETKWIQRWEKQKLFESDPDSNREKYFVTVAYPYPNSPQHIGHGRTYTLADTHARYMRMKGYNVLFPMGFHYTGTPILGMSRRVAAGDADLMDTFHTVYKLSDDVITTFVEPVKIASYFHHEIKMGMKEMGYSIDWRREFTTIDTVYSKFISWQFRTLQKKGLVVQGSHPVGWCPRDQNPVSQHDTIGDVEPDFNEYTVVKFKSIGGSRSNANGLNGEDDVLILPAATLRPETLFGVTNIWINPEFEYVQAQVNGQRWIISKDAARKLEFLNHSVSVEKTIRGNEMVGWKVTNPLTNTSVPIYPASFVEPDSGTGIVMSVPAHAPYDYQALEALKSDEKVKQLFHIAINGDEIHPLKIIESEAYTGNVPAAEAIKQVGALEQNPDEHELLDKATSDLYSHEFYKGKMMQNTGRFAGMTVAAAKSEVKQDLLQSGWAETIYELVNKPVKCRCGTECVVKLLSDQWFLNYGDREWKELAHRCLNKMDILPQDIRQEFNYVIDWLRERACARKSGLGTKLPWDREWIIESLSDSVIYMAYYIIAKYVNSKAISDYSNNITDAFFDYVLLGIGSADKVSEECKITLHTIQQIRNEFDYFYPLDSRHSGRDLVPNHLTFFIFNHVAIFEEKKWPQQIVVNGSVLMEGKKMSKSLGNIIPLRAAIKEYGADTIRLAMLVSAEILQDADFSFDTVRGIRQKLAGIFEIAEKCRSKQNDSSVLVDHPHSHQLQLEDRWLVSRLQRTITETSASMDRLRIREAIYYILYSLDRDLQWYLKRAAARKRENINELLVEFLNLQVRMLAPFAPFTAEEIWELLNNKQPLSEAGWPALQEQKIDVVAEESEFLISSLLEDIQNIVKVTRLTPTKIVVYASAAWKARVYKAILSNILEGRINFGQIMKQLIANPETEKAKSDPKVVQKMMEDILSAPLEARNRRLELKEFNEVTTIQDAISLLSHEANKAQILVYSEEDPIKYDPKSRAKAARPFKPAIYIE
ncbi:MAG: leucine--tRNA ligase [Thermoproteota archaeon]|nr:leucine--tRNA ligase [Thermoproteota archaeon]